MSGFTAHTQAEIVAQLFIDMGFVVEQATGSDDEWSVHSLHEPDSPPNTLTVYNSTGDGFGWDQTTGERNENLGVMFRVRSADSLLGRRLLEVVKHNIDQVIYNVTVVIEGMTYRIHCITRTGDIIGLGFEKPSSESTIHTLNAVVVVNQEEPEAA